MYLRGFVYSQSVEQSHLALDAVCARCIFGGLPPVRFPAAIGGKRTFVQMVGQRAQTPVGTWYGHLPDGLMPASAQLHGT